MKKEIDRRGRIDQGGLFQPPKSIFWQRAILNNDKHCRACRYGWTDGVERAGKNSVILDRPGMRFLKARVIAHYKANHPEITVS